MTIVSLARVTLLARTISKGQILSSHQMAGGAEQTFPNDGGLSFGFQYFMGGLGEGIQSLLEGLSSRVQGGLGLFILSIASRVDFITTGAEIGAWEQGSDRRQQVTGELRGVGRSKAQLPSRWLVGVRRPRCLFGTSDVLRERLVDDGGVTWGVNLDQNIDTTL
jgi:hypothetical protein